MAALATIAWRSTHLLDPYAPLPAAASSAPPLQVDVVALRWKWLFLYPAQGIATVNALAFPARTPVHFLLTADGPMSSFWIPQLGSQIYAMAAMQTQLTLEADRPGAYEGRDTEINGDGYAGMAFRAVAVPPQDFAAWAAQAKSSPQRLDRAAYEALAQPSSSVPPAFYGSIDPDLFAWIVTKDMTPPSGMKPGM